MPSPFTEEQVAFAKSVRDFAAKEAGTRAQRAALTNDFTEAHNQDLYKQMASFGWPGVLVSPEYGGAGAGMVELCILLEEIYRGQLPANGIATTVIVGAAYANYGNDEPKRQIL